MIKHFLLILCLLCAGYLSGQHYYGLDHSLHPIDNKSEAIYFLDFEKSDTGNFVIHIYYSSMKLLMNGNSIDSLGQRLDGLCTFYYETGKVQSEGIYIKGRKSGAWKRYNQDGSPKSDRIYSDINMETIIFNSALIMPKPNCSADGFEEFIKTRLIIENALEIIELSPIAIQLVINVNGEVAERMFDERLSLEKMKIIDSIIRQIPSWEAGYTGTQKINVRVNYSIDFSNN